MLTLRLLPWEYSVRNLFRRPLRTVLTLLGLTTVLLLVLVVIGFIRGKKTSLAKVAEACGCDNVIECKAEETADVLRAALGSDKMTIIVCKCESGNIPVPNITIPPVVIRDRFMTEVEKRNR